MEETIKHVGKLDEISSTGGFGNFVNWFINFWNEILAPIFGFMVPVTGIAGGIGGIMDVVIK